MSEETMLDMVSTIKVLADEIRPTDKTRQSLRAAISAIAADPYRDSVRAAAHKRWNDAMRKFLGGDVVEAYTISQSILEDLGERR